MYNEVRAGYGLKAVDAGTPDRGQNDDQTDLTDTLANMMHWASEEKLDFPRAVALARLHYMIEVEDREWYDKTPREVG